MKPKTQLRKVIVLLGLVHILVLFAGFIAPYGATEQERDLAYAPPTRLHFVAPDGLHLRPFICAVNFDGDSYTADVAHSYPVRFLMHGDPYTLLGLFRTDIHLFGVDSPGRIMLLGTDAFGRDELSRLLVGGQISLAAGLLATLLTLALAAVIGTIAGFYGRWIDESLMGASELFLALPWLYFLLGLRSFLPLHVSPVTAFLLVTGIIGLIGWARPARLVRGVVLSVRTRNYVLAARGLGASDFYLLRRHILPETFGVLLTQAALLVPAYVAAEAALSFFGLGVSEPTPSWGNMLAALQHYSVLVSYAWLLAPACALVITSVIYGLLADALHASVKSH